MNLLHDLAYALQQAVAAFHRARRLRRYRANHVQDNSTF